MQEQKMMMFNYLVAILLSIASWERVCTVRAVDYPATAATCPYTWFVPSGPNGECHCGHTFDGVVSCDEDTKQVRVLDCFCMTFDQSRNKTVLGECLYNCLNVSKSYYDYMYHSVPRNLESDNNSVCGYMHRNGTLCGQCNDSHYRPAYSYTLSCIYCERSQWLMYLMAAYIPMTLFVIFILVFRVSVVSPQLYGMISVLQILASPFNVNTMQKAGKYYGNVYGVIQCLIVMLGIWNLDFFRSVLPNICLRIDALQNLTLDYLIAVYPMAVTVVAFLLLQLYYRGFGPIIFMCRPFQRMFATLRQGFNLHTTLIDAFVTFFILSTTKILHVSVSILLSVRLFDAHGENLGFYWYEDASIEFFDSVHRPYAVLAVIIIFLLILVPIALLVCYQFSFCQLCLTKTRIKGQLLEEIMHSFNKYYKDGSGGTWDCRWFAAFPLAMRLGMCLLLFGPLTSLIYSTVQMYTLVCSIVVLILEPYKEEYSIHNRLLPCMHLFLSFIFTAATGFNIGSVEDRVYDKPLSILAAVVAVVPFVYFSVLIMFWVCKRAGFGSHFTQQSLISSLLPDRLMNSADYV